MYEELRSMIDSGAAIAVAAVFGAIWGSFLNVCIARVPRGESVIRPGSRCMSCGRPVRAWDNIPILSYFILRGRCRACGARFSARYAGVEALTSALAALLWVRLVTAGHGPPAVLLGRWVVYFAFTAVLITLTFIDIDTRRLPDVITLPSIPVFFLAAFAAHDVPWQDRAIGAAAGYLFVRLVSDGYYYILKREGLGLGDGKLLAVVGVVLGWKALPFVLFAASILGTAIAIPVLLVHRFLVDRHAQGEQPSGSLRLAEVPFGPYLAAAAVGYVFFQQPIALWLRETLLLL